jgi:uncharacterized membrane protein HdeD (DUF308 family)
METLTERWWAIALRGAVAILFGIILFAWPGISLAFLVALFGAFAIVDGIFNLVSAIGRARAHESWGSLVLVGITSILAGLIAWIWPGVTAVALLFVIGAWAIITGIFELVAAVQLRKTIRGEFWLGFAGVLSIVFGILLFVNPAAGALSVLWLIGAYAIVLGISLIGLSLRLRSYGVRRHATV